MPRAIWNGTVLAEASPENTKVLEGNIYFPPDALNREYLQRSDTKSVCPWKGLASYYDVVVDGKTNRDAAWYYPETTPLAKRIQGYVAFWKGVKVEE